MHLHYKEQRLMAVWRDNLSVLWGTYDSHELTWKQEQFFNL
jgi:hypothetical protein